MIVLKSGIWKVKNKKERKSVASVALIELEFDFRRQCAVDVIVSDVTHLFTILLYIKGNISN